MFKKNFMRYFLVYLACSLILTSMSTIFVFAKAPQNTPLGIITQSVGNSQFTKWVIEYGTFRESDGAYLNSHIRNSETGTYLTASGNNVIETQLIQPSDISQVWDIAPKGAGINKFWILRPDASASIVLNSSGYASLSSPVDWVGDTAVFAISDATNVTVSGNQVAKSFKFISNQLYLASTLNSSWVIEYGTFRESDGAYLSSNIRNSLTGKYLTVSGSTVTEAQLIQPSDNSQVWDIAPKGAGINKFWILRPDASANIVINPNGYASLSSVDWGGDTTVFVLSDAINVAVSGNQVAKSFKFFLNEKQLASRQTKENKTPFSVALLDGDNTHYSNWIIEYSSYRESDGTYISSRIKNVATGLYLTAANGGQIIEAERIIEVSDNSQIWDIAQQWLDSNRWWLLRPDLSGNIDTNQNSYAQLGTISWSNPRFSFEPEASVIVGTNEVAFKIKSIDTNKYLISAVAPKLNVPFSVITLNADNTQYSNWIIEYSSYRESDGTYISSRIKNVATGLYLTSTIGGEITESQRIIDVSDTSQVWDIAQQWLGSNRWWLLRPDLSGNIDTNQYSYAQLGSISWTNPRFNFEPEASVIVGTNEVAFKIKSIDTNEYLVSSNAPPAYFSTYKVSVDDQISNISINTTVGQLYSSLSIDSGLLLIKDSNNIELASINKITTGTTIETTHNGIIYSVVIFGDVNGNGNIDVTDLANIKSHILRSTLLSGDYFSAGDISSKGSVTISDLLAIKKSILGISAINQNSYPLKKN